MTIDQATIERMTRNEADMSFKKRVRAVFDWLPPRDDLRILDCACGRGFYLNMYRHVSNCELVGLELDAAIIRKAQRNVGYLPGITLVQGDIYRLPFPDDYFDGVILSEILEHVADDVAGLREVWRVLKPGGVVAITVPNANYPFWWDPINKTLEKLFNTHISCGPLAGIWANHLRLYARDDLRAAVEAGGFIVEAERNFTHHCMPFIHNLVYGLGKPLLESGLMPKGMADAADRTTFDQEPPRRWNPIALAIAMLNWFDRKNAIDEPPERSTVNLAVKARKPEQPGASSPPERPAEHDAARDPDSGAAIGGGAEPVIFEDLTLAQAVGYLFWRPGETLRLFWRVLRRDPEAEARAEAAARAESVVARPAERVRLVPPPPEAVPAAAPTPAPEPAITRPRGWAVGQVWAWIATLAVTLLLAVRGGHVLYDAATDPDLHSAGDTNGALVWFMLAGVLAVGWYLWAGRRWWARQFPARTLPLRRLFYANDMPYAWATGLGTLLAALLLLGGLRLGGAWWAGVWFFLAGALWLVIAVGTVSPEDDLPPPEPRRAQVWNVLVALLSVVAAGAAALLHGVDAVTGAGVVTAVLLAGALTVLAAWDARRLPLAARDAAPQPAGSLDDRFWLWFQAHVARLALLPVALLMSSLAYTQNVTENARGEVVDIEFTAGGFWAWVVSIGLWVVILGVDLRRAPVWLRQAEDAGLRPVRDWLRRLRPGWTFAALAAITALGAYFRLHDLASTPPEMTSDHIEKLLDAMRVEDGYRGVFFPNNGGREGFQMYLVALVANVFGVGLSFDALKIATVIEGVITIPVLWWMARQVVGTDTARRRELGNWAGLALAGLVAISAWHVMLSRLGLRIVLTPLTTALVLGFLARVMRHNRMRDTLALGLTLGAGTYFYQANRMLPGVVVIGVVLALLAEIRRARDIPRLLGDGIGFAALALAPVLVYWYGGEVLARSTRVNVRDLGERLTAFVPLFAMVWFSLVALAARQRSRDRVLRYGGGLLAAAVVALAVYIPMYHYSELRPDDFWNRTRGRLFGENAFVRSDSAGNLVSYDPSLSEQAERFWDQRGVFADNYEDALLMYHWEGDGAWISNAFGHPALGGLTGGLLVLGLVLWGVRLFREPDPVHWLIPASVLVMLLPSALTLAYTVENPSFTRASGTIPGVFLLAALPVGALCWRLTQLPWRTPALPGITPRGVVLGGVAAVIVLAAILGGGLGSNWDNYFEDYRLNYSYSWKPYREISKPLRAFAGSEGGSYGNAFYVHHTHWLDHRILGAMAGDIRWPNGLVNREDVFAAMARNEGTRYEYDPTQPLFFMYHPDDLGTLAFLQENFPGGTTELYEYSYETHLGELHGEFYIYMVAWSG